MLKLTNLAKGLAAAQAIVALIQEVSTADRIAITAISETADLPRMTTVDYAPRTRTLSTTRDHF